MEKLLDMSKKNRIPIYSNIQLTYKCNFQCLHCYQTPLRTIKLNSLCLEDWKRIIDTLKEKHVIFLHFTGGEVLCRQDFLEIYEYAYNKKFKIGISTNASLFTDNIINYLSKKKPYKIAITLYGMTVDTYESFCRVMCVQKILENILKLKKVGIDIFLKAIANKYNRDELVDIRNFALENDIKFFAFFKINNYINGSRYPISLELSMKEIYKFQKLFGQLASYIDILQKKKTVDRCTVGLNIVNIDPLGRMYLCECSQNHKWSILEKGFDFCWEQIGEERKREFDVECFCNSCDINNYCNMCPPLIKYRYGKLCRPVDECNYAYNIKRMVEMCNEKSNI